MARANFAAVAGLWLLAACGEVGPSADAEVAAELRALRAVLVQQPHPVAAIAPPADRAQIATALQPLREVLDALVASQRELQTRQLSLTQELQRWSQLVAEGATGARREQGDLLVQRLQQLEATLLEQDTRHRQVEVLMQGALDRTADRLEDFLRRLGEVAAPPVPDRGNEAAPPAPNKAATESVEPASSATGTSNGGGGGAMGYGGTARTSRGLRATSIWWWALAASLSAGIGLLFFWRLRRLPLRSEGRLRSRVETQSMPFASRRAEEASDGGADEIWAAAALLGEAVGRLKQSSTEPQAVDETAALVAAAGGAGPEDLDGGDLFVLDEEPLADPTFAAALPRPSASAANRHERPPVVVCHLRTTDPTRARAAVLHILGTDPRVLRRPEPAVAAGEGMVEACFEVMPDLPPGERSQLEQRLRDAVA